MPGNVLDQYYKCQDAGLYDANEEGEQLNNVDEDYDDTLLLDAYLRSGKDSEQPSSL